MVGSSIVNAAKRAAAALAFLVVGLAHGTSYNATFTQISNSSTPGAAGWRGWSAMTWVGGSINRIVMWGGSAGNFLNDIVALDPVTGAWTTIDPNNYCVGNTSFEPNGSDENSLVWDPVGGRLWLYNGGSGYRCASSSLVGRTAGAGTTSTSIVDPTLSTSVNYKDWLVRAPNGGKAYVTAYDAATRTLTLSTPLSVVAGGTYDLFVDFGDGTWAYNFSTGTYAKLQQVHWGYAGYVPSARRSAGLASDGTQAFLFGGTDWDNGLYRLDYATSAYTVAIPQGAASSPPARGQIQGQFVYDSVHDKFVLFGGRCFETRCTYYSLLDDTWIYDPNTNQWTQATPIVRPPARNQGQMYFDAGKGVVVLYGGIGSSVFNDVWTFDVATLTWTQQVVPAVNPGGVYLGQVAYADTTQCGYIVYGLTSGAQATYGTWKLCLAAAGSNQAPVASFTATPSSTTVGSAIALSAAASSDPDGSITSYAWSFGDGTTGNGVSTSKSYAAAGTYTITLTVTDNGGATATTTRTVTVTPTSGGSPIWVEDALPTGAGAGGNEAFTWVTSSPTPYSGGKAHQSSLASGIHQHYFTGANPKFPVATGDRLFTYVYLDPANPPKEVMLQWYDGSWEHRAYWGASLIPWGGRNMGALPPAGQWVRLEVPAALVGLEGRMVEGMSFALYDGRATWDYTGVVQGTGTNQPPIASFTTTPSTVAPGTPIALSAAASSDPDGSITSYAWNFGDGTTGTGASTSKSYAAPGTYTITLTVTDNGGATGSTTRTVTVTASNQPPVASFTATPSSTTIGSAIALSAAASSDPDGSITSYAWNFGDGTTGTGASTSKSYAAAGTYTITLTVTDNGGATGSTTRTVTVTASNQPPVASFTATPSSTIIGSAIVLSAAASSDPDGSITGYAWNFGDGTTGTGASTSKSYAAAGTYTITLTVTDNGGATATTTRTVTVTAGSTSIWIEDALPTRAGVGGSEAFTWVTSSPAPYSGIKAHQSTLASGIHQHYFTGVNPKFPVAVGDRLFTYVYLDPVSPPRQVMLQWYDGSWEHRAYWGAPLIPWGGANMGALPPAGQWVRLEVPAALVGLEGRMVDGMAFTLYDGRATWDYTGIVKP